MNSGLKEALIMKVNKIRTYADKLFADKKFREEFEREYKNLVISEKIAQLRHKARLTQEELAQRIHTTKSAISRYESNNYQGYSVSLLQKIAAACGVDLRISFTKSK
jgi:DNA-binding XRE family transcriptional regulator